MKQAIKKKISLDDIKNGMIVRTEDGEDFILINGRFFQVVQPPRPVTKSDIDYVSIQYVWSSTTGGILYDNEG